MYTLSHQYTDQSHAWDKLKGSDDFFGRVLASCDLVDVFLCRLDATAHGDEDAGMNSPDFKLSKWLPAPPVDGKLSIVVVVVETMLFLWLLNMLFLFFLFFPFFLLGQQNIHPNVISMADTAKATEWEDVRGNDIFGDGCRFEPDDEEKEG